MSGNQTLHGTKSRNVERVTPKLFKAHSGQFLFMMKDYFKKSLDKSSDPVASFALTKERLEQDDNFMLLAYMDKGIPMGFLAADVVNDRARITTGYIDSRVNAATKNVIIDQAMEMLEAWAKQHSCKTQVFLTYRAPGAHRFMLKRGWEYELSMYKREINHG